MPWSPTDFEAGFRARLLAAAPVAALIGDRILPLAEAANPGYPCMTYTASYNREPDMQGGPWRATVDLFCLSTSSDQAGALAKAAREAMDVESSDKGLNFACGTGITVTHWRVLSINKDDYTELTDAPIFVVLLGCDALLDVQ